MKKRRIDKVGEKKYIKKNNERKKKVQYSPTKFSNKCYESRFRKNAAVDQFWFHPFSFHLFFFTPEKLCPPSLCPSGSEVSLGSVHGVLSFPPPGPHGYFPSMIQEFWGVTGDCCRSAVELKPEIGALVRSSGALRRSGMRVQSEQKSSVAMSEGLKWRHTSCLEQHLRPNTLSGQAVKG